MDEEALLNGTDTATGPEIQVEHHNAEAGPSTPALSKNAQKRAARLAKQEAQKPIKRAAERERRRVRAAQLKEGYLNGTLSPEELAIVEGRKVKEQLRKSTKKRFTAAGEVRAGDESGSEEDGMPRRKKAAKAPWDGAVLIDMGFDNLMKEIKSMASQISYCYASNRQAKIPVRNVIHTSASHASSPRLWPPLEKAPCERWIGCHWFGGHLEEYLKVFQTGRETGTSDDAAVPAPAGIDASTHKLVYLSADAEEELDTLREDEVYIIGGIVDRNRYKNLCQNKAEKLEMRTARLPIGAYIDNLPTRKVLTVNQVFQILTEYIDKRDWKAAFEAVIPIRKYSQIGRRKQKKLAAAQGGAEEEIVDAEGDDDDGDEEAEEAKELPAEIAGVEDTQPS